MKEKVVHKLWKSGHADCGKVTKSTTNDWKQVTCKACLHGRPSEIR